jgi:hypothetical protein
MGNCPVSLEDEKPMPSSVPYAMAIIASVARQLRPASVLDVGVGFGKYGYLFREYLDIWELQTVADYGRDHWKTVIEGVEATPQYITPLHDYIYDRIHVGDITEIIDTLGTYDVIMMGDVLEHFEKHVGERLLHQLLAHAEKCMLLTFPVDSTRNEDVIGNPYEAHRSAWNRRDFRRFAAVEYKLLEGRTAIVAIAKPPHPAPLLAANLGARRRSGWKGFAASLLVHMLGPMNASRLASWLGGQSVVLRV